MFKKVKYRGFTLIESLLALSVLTMTCLFFSIFIRHLEMINKQIRMDKEKEWHVFLIQMENELEAWQYQSITPTKLVVEHAKETMEIEHRLKKIIKVKNNGYQPLLTEVKESNFSIKNKKLTIVVTFENNETYKGSWTIQRVGEK